MPFMPRAVSEYAPDTEKAGEDIVEDAEFMPSDKPAAAGSTHFLPGTLFENNHCVMLLLDPDTGRIVDANVAACRFYGHDKNALTRMQITDINTLSEAEARQEMQDAREERRDHFFFRHRVAGGEIRDVEVFSGPVEIGGKIYLHSIVHDISERKAIEAALKESEKMLSDVFESIQDGISVLDTDLTIRRVNSVMNRWYAPSRPLEGKKCYHCYHGKEHPCSPCPTLQCMQTGNTEVEVVPGLPGSPVRWVELYSYPIRDRRSGEISGVVEFVRNITDKKELEANLQQAQKMEAIGTLAGGIAHDFNNLLMGIQGRISLITSELETSPMLMDHLEGIEEYVKSATALTRQLLGLAQEGKYQVKPADINHIVHRSARMFSRTKKEIRIVEDLHPEQLPAEVDSQQIEQVLLNLYLNAWQAMPSGGDLVLKTRNIVLEPGDAQLHGVGPGPYVKVSVIDAGTGMEEEILPRIFDPFFTTKERGRGTGLGLASAYGIIKNHGGFMDVASEPGSGSTFDFFLPASNRAIVPEPSRIQPYAGGSETILLVDDEEMILEVAQPMLEKLGYTVRVASSGSEALAIFSRDGEEIDLVILDLVMPGMAGGEAFDRIRELDSVVPVLLSSGYSIDGQAAAILERGCNGFIQKPFTMERLSRKVRSVLDRIPS